MSLSELASFLTTPWGIILAIFFFAASIFVHELGHFMAARWRGLVVERFSIGFGPRLFGWTKNGVDWRISAIPLGGYVLLPQLADMGAIEGESSYKKDSEKNNEPKQVKLGPVVLQFGEEEEEDRPELPPITLTDKLIVSAAGAFYNVLFALALATIVWAMGLPRPASEMSTTVGYVAAEVYDRDENIVPGAAFEAGILPGDLILSIDGREVQEWIDIRILTLAGTGRSETGLPEAEVLLERGGETMTVIANPVLTGRDGIRTLGLVPAADLFVDAVSPGSPAERAGLQPGDRFVSIDGEPIRWAGAFRTAIAADPEGERTLIVEREGTMHTLVMRPELVVVDTADNTRRMLGFRMTEDTYQRHQNPFSQLEDAVLLMWRTLSSLVSPSSDVGLRHLSGPVGIADAIARTADFGILEVLNLVVLINVNLAILNLLPIPVLDGGHMVFAILGKLRGRPLPANFIASLQGSFMLLLLGLMVYVTFFDVGRLGNRGGGSIPDDAPRPVAIVFDGEDAILEDAEAEADADEPEESEPDDSTGP